MADKLTWDEIKLKYPDEWVVLIDYEVEGVDPTAGVVVDHGAVKADVYRRLPDAPSPAAVLFTGSINGGLFGFREDLEGEGRA